MQIVAVRYLPEEEQVTAVDTESALQLFEICKTQTQLWRGISLLTNGPRSGLTRSAAAMGGSSEAP